MATAISTTVDIEASPVVIWEALTDFAAYGEWNPFMQIEGSPKVGTKLVVHMTPKGGRAMTFKPTVMVATPGQELRWLGRLGVRGIFDGEHSFVLTPNVDGSTRLTHGESFSGVLVAFMRGTLEKTHSGFEDFNQTLKRRVEAAPTSR